MAHQNYLSSDMPPVNNKPVKNVQNGDWDDTLDTPIYNGGQRTSNYRNSSNNWRHRDNSSRNDYPRRGGNRYQRNYNSEPKMVISLPMHKLRKKGNWRKKIYDLQEETGTRIHIDRVNEYEEVDVTIYGSPENQKKCNDMIMELVNEKSFLSLFASSEPVKDEPCVIDWDAVNKACDEYQKKRWANYPPLKKDFYVVHPEVARMSEGYVRKLRESLNNLTVGHAFDGDGEIPKPVETFEQAFAHYPDILEVLSDKDFKTPTPIQCQAWPIIMSGFDMIGIAQTGTGKTLAFLLPALIHIVGQETPISERSGPNVIILAPTRELALQINTEIQKYAYHNIESTCIYGGGERKQQIGVVKNGVQIITATPGRLNDLVESGYLKLDSVTYVVLDEADRMLDVGFEPQIKKILLSLRPDRQTVMTSATWPFAVEDLAKRYMNKPVKVVVGSLDLAAVKSVHQEIVIIDEIEKREYLRNFIDGLTEEDKVIIFVAKKKTVDFITCDLALEKIDVQSIHGGRDQTDREQAIEDLKNGSVRILIATDVASRGIDITDITKVLNYDFPNNIEEYVHRVGRTGRAGKTGHAVTLFTKKDASYAKKLISILQQGNQEVPSKLFEFQRQWESGDRPRGGRGGRSFGRHR